MAAVSLSRGSIHWNTQWMITNGILPQSQRHQTGLEWGRHLPRMHKALGSESSSRNKTTHKIFKCLANHQSAYLRDSWLPFSIRSTSSKWKWLFPVLLEMAAPNYTGKGSTVHEAHLQVTINHVSAGTQGRWRKFSSPALKLPWAELSMNVKRSFFEIVTLKILFKQFLLV